MANTNQIITLALSKLGISGGLKKPRQEDLDLGLETLKAYYRNLITSGALGRARNTVLTQDGCYTASENERILRASEGVDDIQMPLTVVGNSYADAEGDYGFAACIGQPRPPKHGCFVVVNDAFSGASMEFIYDGYINQWCEIHNLVLEDENNDASYAPLMANVNGAAARLAAMLADHYDAKLHEVTARDALLFDAALVQANGEHQDTMPGNYF